MAESVYVPSRLSMRNQDRFRALFRFLYERWADVEIHGLEHLPEGGCLVAPNHLSWFDAPLVFAITPSRRITAFAADKYRYNPIMAPIVQIVDTIWVHRGASTPSTIKMAIRAVKNGSLIGIAPEGTRSPDGKLQQGKTGAVFLALSTGAPVVPLGLDNTDEVGKAIAGFRRVKITMRFGPPVTFKVPPGQRSNHELQMHYTEELMCRIAALIPPERRGVYADHPRLKEFLEK